MHDGRVVACLKESWEVFVLGGRRGGRRQSFNWRCKKEGQTSHNGEAECHSKGGPLRTMGKSPYGDSYHDDGMRAEAPLYIVSTYSFTMRFVQN